MPTGLRTLNNVAAAAVVAAGLGVASSAVAEDDLKTPWVRIVVPIEVQNDWNFKTDDSDRKTNQLFATIEPELTIGIFKGLIFRAQAVYEPTTDPDAGENRLFEDQGLYLETLMLEYETNIYETETRSFGIQVYGGKFTPTFGIAWDEAPGIYGTDFAEDYELTERIGFGFGLVFEDSALGKHVLTFSTFFADTSVLSDSWLNGRGRLRLADGGPSNTGRFNSYQVGLAGERPFGFEGLSYHVSFVSQAVTGMRSELGLALALKYEYKVGDWTITPLIEFVNFWNVEGDRDVDRWYLTTSILVEYKQWNFSVSNTARTTRTKNAGGITKDNLIQVSAGYEFDFGLGVNLGYSYRNEDGGDAHTFGVLLTYELDFSFGRKKSAK